jgi:methyl-accepting chemotaxis protein
MSGLSNISIRNKIILLALFVTAVPSLLISSLSVNNSTSSLENLLAEELMNKASMVGHQIDNFFEQRIADIKVVSQADVLESSDSSSVQQYFDEVLDANPMFVDLMVLSSDKKVISASGGQNRLGSSLESINTALSSLFANVMSAKQGDVFLTDAIKHQGQISVFLMTPITDDSNTIVEAVLLAEAPLKPVEKMVAEFDDSVVGDKSVYLLNDDSQVIVTGDDQQTLFDTFNDLKTAPDVGKATEEDGSSAYVIYEDFHQDLVMAGMADMRAHGKNDALDWGIIAVAELDAIGAPAVELRNTVLVIAFISVVISGLLALFIAKLLVKPLENINIKMRELASGQGDLTQRLEIQSGDEIGSVASSFNDFVGNLHILIEDFKGSAENLGSFVQGMTDVSAKTKQECIRQQTETDMVASAITEMSAAAHEVAGNAQEAADAAKNADSLSQQGSMVVQDTISSISSLAQELKSATGVINNLETDVSNISSMVDVIRGIAEQTNLLALNAAIEAARAGEQGRGFAVVADEVRTLANKTQESTEEINRLIGILQEASIEAVQSMEKSMEMSNDTSAKADMAGTSLSDIALSVSTISNMNIQIAAAAEEQTAVTEDLTRNVMTISDATGHVTEAAMESEKNSERISEISMSIRDKVKRFVV